MAFRRLVTAFTLGKHSTVVACESGTRQRETQQKTRMKDRLIRKFEEEIQALDRELKLELPQEIRRARELGDLRENAEYAAAKERQRLVEARISQLRQRVSEIALLNVDRIPVGRAGFGSTLHVAEGSETLVQRARDNAARNGLAAKTQFAARNLFEIAPADLASYGNADRWLVDPPREGAFALAKAVADVAADPSTAPGWLPPHRIVYVSCNPATLARDAGLLVHQAGYRCSAAGAVNMFPHTAHVESLAVFDRD